MDSRPAQHDQAVSHDHAVPQEFETGERTTVRAVFQQPSLAAYRIAFYQHLARDYAYQIRVIHGGEAGIRSVQPEGFFAAHEPLSQIPFLGKRLIWHGTQLRYATRRQSDVLVLVWNTQFLSLLPALIRCRITGVRSILWGHGYSKREGWLRKKARFLMARIANGCVFYTRVHRDRAVAAGLVHPDKAFYATNAMDTQVTPAEVDDRRGSQELLDFQQRNQIRPQQTLLYVSRLGPENRLDLALKAMHELADECPDLELIVIGDGSQQPLREEADRLGIAQRVRFLGPIYDYRQVGDYMLSARAMIYPDNIGLSLVHAMQFGLPVITHGDGDVHGPEFVYLHDEQNSLLYQRGSLPDLVRVVRRAIHDDAWHAQASHHALHQSSPQYSTKRMADEFHHAICSVRGPRQRNPKT
ncbi:MAG: glycosyltransferase family 4 protein [Planctomycetota bacterium]